MKPTDEQLRAIEKEGNLIVSAGAGSGKTVMAIKKAKRLAAQDKSVLLLCYNQLLAKVLKRSVQDFPKIKAVAFFDLCIELLKIPENQLEKYRDNPRLYNEVLPALLKKHIEQTCIYYDAVIVDEGQDFTKAAWSAISALPEEDGHFYIFYDPDQNIYTNDLQLPDFGIPPVILNRNCRNTKNIFNELKPYQTISSSAMESSPVGARVRTLRGNCRRNLETELERLMIFEKVPPQDIVILGAHSLKNTCIGDDTRVGRYRVVSTALLLKKFEVRYFTFMKYKGCESPVVILLDVDDNDLRWKNRRCIYTAMSRAVNELIILHK